MLPLPAGQLRCFTLPGPRCCKTLGLAGKGLRRIYGRNVTQCSSGGVKPLETRRFAVLGAGFAGLSLTWHLLQHTAPGSAIAVDLFDKTGLGAGASGASGGLLHPFSPKGKLLWRGEECWTAALDLLMVAEAANAREIKNGVKENKNGEEENVLDESERSQLALPLAWYRGLLRPAVMAKHADDFRQYAQETADSAVQNGVCSDASCISEKAAVSLLPGLVATNYGASLFLPKGITVHSQGYLEALWRACQQFAAGARTSGSLGTTVTLNLRHITSLAELEGDGYEGIAVCLGAEALQLPELAQKLPLKMSRGVVLKMHPSVKGEEYPVSAPSLLGETWLAVQGSKIILLGATKDEGNGDTCPTVSAVERKEACEELLPKAGALYPAINSWQVASFKAGVRAMPPRTDQGALPIVGCLDEIIGRNLNVEEDGEECRSRSGNGKDDVWYKWWIVGGLGSRGLIYHAWLGQLTAKAMVKGCPKELPLELSRWMKGPKKKSRQRDRQRKTSKSDVVASAMV